MDNNACPCMSLSCSDTAASSGRELGEMVLMVGDGRAFGGTKVAMLSFSVRRRELCISYQGSLLLYDTPAQIHSYLQQATLFAAAT